MSNRNINCPLHGFITLTPRMCQIIDTPEWKRLHNLRQLGVAYIVYPSANQTRAEHSLGVSHLGKLLATSLQQNQPELEISDNDIELIQIAGLVHDIGHGPFSHLYDDIFVKAGELYHEERGIIIFKQMVATHNIPLTENEVKKIIHMIDPPDILTKQFLYQIIANKISSIDVDKIDYIQRDSYHIGFGLSEKYERLITMCRVVNFEGNRTLAWPEKLQDEILSLFETRYRLHKKVYNHHTVKAGEYIITEILDNMLKDVNLDFSKLNDAMILFPVNEKVIALKEKIDKRELPKMIGERVLSYNEVTEEVKQFEQKLDNIVAILNGCNIENRGWSKIKIGFISGHGGNPLKRVVYFKKNEDPHYLEEYTSFMAPKNYQEYIYRIYINDSKQFDNAKSIWLHTI